MTGVILPLAAVAFIAHGLAGRASGPLTRPETSDVLGATGHFFVGIAAVLACAYIGGAIAERVGQPRVVGEICAGLALGPSVLGRAAEGVSDWLFPEQILPMFDGLAQLGLVLFMFGVGQELAGMRLRGLATQTVLVSQASFLVPLAVGTAAALPMLDSYSGAGAQPLVFALFIGCSLSVTAFPVLARILSDLGMMRTRHGRLSLVAAAVGDGSCWLVLAAVLAAAHGSHPAGIAVNALVAAAVAVVFIGPLRRWMGRWREHAQGHTAVPVLLVTGIAATSALTAAVGIHQLIGALLVGLAWPAKARGADSSAEQLVTTAKTVLLPFFFFGFGLTVDLGTLHLDGRTLTTFVSLLLLATASKMAGPAACAWLTGMPFRTAVTLGVLLNTRGLTELVILQIGYQAGILSKDLLTILTVVALATTAMTTPILRIAGLNSASGELPSPSQATASAASARNDGVASPS